ncbi:hypothetical protein HK104_010964 [Borealophlyctis nickersoniae]|nr:hypothetical protein HK104_010964 [Borealophlyctis nickersoniae]
MSRSEPRRVTGGASFIVGWRLAGKNVLVVGGGKEASGRVFFALDADARVTLVAPYQGLNPEIRTRIARGELVHVDRSFEDTDLETEDEGLVDMVLSCIDDHEESRRIADLCHALRIPVNCADIPDLCDFYFMAQHREGNLQIGVSTNGCGPRLGARLRNHVVQSLPPRVAESVGKVGALRRKIRRADPEMTEEAVGRRMKWLSRLCDQWSFQELADMDDDAVMKLLDAYEKGEQVPPASASGRQQGGAKASSNGALPRPPATLTSYAQSVPLVGGLLGPLTAVAVGTVSVGLGAATSVVSTATGIASSCAQAAKVGTECVVERSLNLLPRPIAAPVRTGLSYLPLPIRISSGRKGRILLVGAGPGDPGLLTVDALNALRTADLVVSDQLVPPRILALIPSTRLRLAMKKVAGRSDQSQDDTNAICLRALRAGQVVARLKGGDPFLFGRGGEEIAFFRSHGFDPVMIPGISSCIAAPGSVGIPVTHRGIADQLLVLSGRGEGGTLPEVPLYHAKRTTVVLMAVGRLPQIVELMKENGHPISLPAAVVEKGCWGNGEERVIDGNLGNICERVKAAAVGSPALLVVGGVVDALKDVDGMGRSNGQGNRPNSTV